MKTVSGALATHLAGETTTLATCWKVTRADAQVFGFTEHIDNLVIDGLTYVAAAGYTPSAVATGSNLDVDNLTVLGVLDGTIVTRNDVRAGKWDFAQIEIFKVNYRDLSQGKLKLRKGTTGEVRHGKLRFETELRGLSQKLTQNVGRLFGPACDADLGDARCGINLGTFGDGTVNGTLTAVTSKLLVTDAGLAQAAGWFSGGKIVFTSGAAAGFSMEVKTHASGGVLTLQEPLPYLPAISDAYTLTAGCDKLVATCLAKFNNVVNFRGYPHLPGLDRMVSGRAA